MKEVLDDVLNMEIKDDNTINRIKSTLMMSIMGLLVVYFSSISAVFAQATYISPEIFEQYGKDAFWEVSVTCSGISEERVMQRKIDDTEQWCGKEIRDICSADKSSAAELVCGLDYSLKLQDLRDAQEAERKKEAERQQELKRAEQQKQKARQEAQKATERQQELQKQLSVEEQKLAIEEEKLELRRQELELQRRAEEIEQLLNQ